MENKELLLSICIPTNGVVEWVLPVIESIYVQGVDNNLFEVVITDNGGKEDLKNSLCNCNYSNLHYYETTAKGFTNQIDAFEKCSGVFCKMLNHRSKMLPGSIEELINIIRKYQDEKPIIYCAEGHADGGEIIECDDINTFVRRMTHWVSWSAGTGAWRKDLIGLREKAFDKTFPHTVFLFGLRDESKYVIWNKKYEQMGDESGKGGYDVFYAFAVSMIDIFNDLRQTNRITTSTFLYEKSHIYDFLQNLYFSEVILPTTHTFIIKNIKESIAVYFTISSYYWLVIKSYIRIPFYWFRKLIKR